MKERIVSNIIIGLCIGYLMISFNDITNKVIIDYYLFSQIFIFALGYALLMESFTQLQIYLLKYRFLISIVIIIISTIIALWYLSLGIAIAVLFISFCLINALLNTSNYNKRLEIFKKDYKDE